MDSGNIRQLPREELNKIDKLLHTIKDDLSVIPHVVLAAAQVKDEENVGWMHSQVMASMPELTMMFIQMMKSNRSIKRAVEAALDYLKDEDTGSIKSIVDNAVKSMISRIAESDEDFMKSLKEDMDAKSGSDFDVDGLLNEVLGKKKDNKEDDDKKGDK